MCVCDDKENYTVELSFDHNVHYTVGSSDSPVVDVFAYKYIYESRTYC